MAKMTVQLVTWNGAKYIPFLFQSLRKQTFTDWELVVLDNASGDETVALLSKELANFPRPHRLIKNTKNSGFAVGHNILFREGVSDYCLLLNQDMYLEADCLSKMAAWLDTHPAAAAVAPRLMKWNFADVAEKGLQASFSTYIDALGIKVFRNRRAIEQFTQQAWVVVKKIMPSSGVLEVFGVSGAFPLFRRAAIAEVVFSDGAMFDETYHSYKEDLDLAWRLRARGCQAYVILNAIAYHDRGGAGPKEEDDLSAAFNKQKQAGWVKHHSYKNHLRTLYKNEYGQNFFLDFFWIAGYEIKKFCYFLLFDRAVLKGLKEVWQTRRDLKNKRAQIKNLRKASWREMRKWWSEKNNEYV
ncbi:MAG: glycosyltransferase family 2 protein [Candidatus Magasanikbacteria bacterium]|nr:glycosyltransferase family 2 protein [Candidatus Magasanikbacteria bacterium]